MSCTHYYIVSITVSKFQHCFKVLNHAITRDALFQFCFNVSILGTRDRRQALLVYQILLKSVNKNIVYARLCCLVRRRRRRKIRIKSDKFQGLVSQELLGQFLSNLVCKVLYMVTLKYVELVEIGAIVFEL